MGDSQIMPRNRPHVVVVGGGFGGVSAVRALKRADVDVTLVDRHTYNTFQPLLYQVATSTLNPGDITWFLRSIRSKQDNVRFLKGTVTSMEHSTRTINLDGGLTLSYDYLIIASGTTANFFGIPGAEEYSLPLYRRSHALAVRDRMFAILEDAAVNGRDTEFRAVVVGGGPTGVETAGALAEMRNHDMPVTYPEIDTERVHITLVEMAPHVLGPFAPKLRNYARRSLEKRGVDLRLETSVKEVRPDGVIVNDGEFIPADMVIWGSGITTHPVIANWGVPLGRGRRIMVDDHLRVQGLENVYAVGDIAVEDGDRALPQLAQPALQGGKYAAKDIRARLKGKEHKPFSYLDKGTMATIGRSSAVAELRPFGKLTGFFAWVTWIVVHLYFLLGGRNRLATMINLGSRYIFWRGGHNAIVGETPPVIARVAPPGAVLSTPAGALTETQASETQSSEETAPEGDASEQVLKETAQADAEADQQVESSAGSVDPRS
ncbi:NAD(P)/FAD-dependent oxidoreductase [Mumia sp. zg.B17]|uniref:NAD(P)/FAD-dependent oxidoreductase n=1 Tax=Mumia sp. zg.B17 TaxID=2855446 RepID=UPI001C6F541B|nr:NAD(P)/FAD-dependent oxidoreductase [Mumia sp. zg.B17]MBW9204411.1 NAD(P)/FAD-dependent oxidoreductase [Mumia sp. zg.B17]